MKPVSVAIITLNEEKHIGDCIDSVKDLSNDIVVIDSGSTDNTEKIVNKKKAKFIFNSWPGYPRQKQFAVNNTQNDWVLVLDADECLSSECVQEIQITLAKNSLIFGYHIPRYHFFLNKVILNGKGVDFPLRLFNKQKGKFDNRLIHETILVEGDTETLKYGMIHYSSESIWQRIKKIHRDSQMELNHYRPKKVTFKALILDPMTYFLSYTLKRKGYKDGFRGILLTMLFSFQIFWQQFLFLTSPKRSYESSSVD